MRPLDECLLRKKKHEPIPTEGIVYKYENGGYSVTGYNGTDSDVVIASSVEIPPNPKANVVKIGDGAFNGKSFVESVHIPNTIKIIGNIVFQNTHVYDVILPDSVETISGNAFANILSGGGSLIINKNASITTLGGYLGSGSTFSYVKLPNTITEVSLRKPWLSNMRILDFYEDSPLTTIGDSFLRDMTVLQKFVIPSKCTYIGDDVFRRCTSLREFEIPESVSYIGKRAFYSAGVRDNRSITFKIPNQVTEINSNTFYDCSFEEVIVSENVSHIDSGAFAYFRGGKIRFLSNVPPMIESDSLSTPGTIYVISVPVGCADLYKSSPNYPQNKTYIEE